MDNRKPIKWSAFEYSHGEKTIDWYWAVGIIGGAIALTSFIYNNALFAIFIILGTFTLMMYSTKKPRKVSFTIDNRGIIIDKELYPFSTLKSFGILEKENESKLIIQSEKTLAPYIHIPLEGVSSEEVRDFLLDFLDEEDHQESLAETVMDYLGF